MAVRPIDADAVKFSISGLRYIDPNDYFALAEYFMKQVKAMPTLTPPNEWVSVEDAVPDPGERVLATDGVFVGEGYINCYGKWCRPNGMKWNMFNEEVTHWMAMPKSPKEDE